MARSKHPKSKASKPSPYLIKGLTWRAILALIDVHEKHFGDDSMTQSLTTMGALNRRGLVTMHISYDKQQYRCIRARLTKRGESRLAACFFEYADAKSLLKVTERQRRAA